MKKYIKYLAIHALFLSSIAAASPVELYVSKDGADGNPGTKDRPLATLEKARDSLRNLKREGNLPEGAIVWLRGGTYQRDQAFVLNQEDSGTASAPIVYASAPGEIARLSGGVTIPASAFRPADSSFRDAVIDPDARPHILQVDLKALGIKDFGEIQEMTAVDFGSPNHYTPAPLELSVDGRSMTLARWPNVVNDPTMARTGFIDTVRPLCRFQGNETNTTDYPSVSFKDVPPLKDVHEMPGTSYKLGLERFSKWRSPENAWFAGGLVRTYSYAQRRIASYNAEANEFQLASPVHVWPKWGQKYVELTFFFNVPEELDKPGEYYVDREKGILYLYPPSDWNAGSEAIVSVLNDVIVSMEGCSHVRLRGLVLESSRTSGAYIEGGENNVLENCTLRNTGIVGLQIGHGWQEPPPSAPKTDLGAPLKRLPGSYRDILCTGINNQGTALNRNGGKANGMDGGKVYDTGCGGVLLGGGDRKTLEPAGNFVRNAEIHHTDRRVNRYAEAVVVDGVGNLVEHNYLHDNLGGILYIHGNDHLIEFNEICRAILASSDCGAIEIRQNPSQLGNKIRYNYLHDLSRVNVNAQTYAIYLDNGTSGTEISGNVFERIGGRSIDPFGRITVSINGGNGNRIVNNLFVNNTTCNVNKKPTDKDFKAIKGTFTARRFMLEKDVDVTKPPFSTRYPEFLKIYQSTDETGLWNEVSNNVFINCPRYERSTQKPEESFPNLWLDEDPGFVNWAGGDLTLRPDSVVFKKLPGFQPIPFEKMRFFK